MHQTLKLLKSETFTKKNIFFFKLTKRVLWLQVLPADKELLAGAISIIKCLIYIQHVSCLSADFAKCFVFNSVNNNNNFIQLSFLRISFATFLFKERTCNYEGQYWLLDIDQTINQCIEFHLYKNPLKKQSQSDCKLNR